MEIIRHEVDKDADPAALVYTFGGAEPVRSLRPGTIVSTWTADCYGGRVRRAQDLATEVTDTRFINPQTGPFHIEGAEPGDTIAVHFCSITPSVDWGVSTTMPLFGALTQTPFTAMLHDPLPERTWIYDLDVAERLVRYHALDSDLTVDLPMDPMHGTVGVAPALGEVRSSLTPGSWGGNMDTPEMRAGTTCYLGVNVPGALLSLGDGHARQGEGETCGVAVETAMDTVFAVELIKGIATPWPRLEDDRFIMSTGSTRPLEDAFRISHADLVHWIAGGLGLSAMDAYQLVSQTALTPVANVCDENYTVVGKVLKDHLPGFEAYGGTHHRLRSLARAAGV
ncbi:acetamidase/formamidase family protein [Flexivirga caeni]|uniref:Acetamidase n=1 Tax=Flexivirga caeni TaxID=2294115 RepID=A0A3M9MFM5_9MICO|nr:acetamidase/formamidase family protein [Flexivirga caeni]RNI24360.1 acetamidase [Flexivirga caeni]